MPRSQARAGAPDGDPATGPGPSSQRNPRAGRAGRRPRGGRGTGSGAGRANSGFSSSLRAAAARALTERTSSCRTQSSAFRGMGGEGTGRGPAGSRPAPPRPRRGADAVVKATGALPARVAHARRPDPRRGSASFPQCPASAVAIPHVMASSAPCAAATGSPGRPFASSLRRDLCPRPCRSSGAAVCPPAPHRRARGPELRGVC